MSLDVWAWLGVNPLDMPITPYRESVHNNPPCPITLGALYGEASRLLVTRKSIQSAAGVTPVMTSNGTVTAAGPIT